MTTDSPLDDLPEARGIMTKDPSEIATIQNGIQAAKREDGVGTDVEAVCELAEAYTGWAER